MFMSLPCWDIDVHGAGKSEIMAVSHCLHALALPVFPDLGYVLVNHVSVLTVRVRWLLQGD